MNERHAISLVLNAHLPFIRHPEHPRFFEERWLFEAISDTYLPLLRVFERLDKDHIPYKVAMVFSPTLSHMLGDPLLIERYLEFLDSRIEFGAEEVRHNKKDKRLYQLSSMYYDRLVEDRVLFTERYEHNLLKAFDYYQKKGRLELLTTAATYAFLPFFLSYPEAIQAQIEVAIASHRAAFGRNPQGFWLPELGWYPGLDDYLRAYNFNYSIVDTHGLLFGQPVPSKGVFAPVRTRSSLAVLGRNLSASMDIWDAENGYPNHPVYRDFYRDAGYDLPRERIESFLESDGARTPTGFKYWAVSGKGKEKKPYDPVSASEQCALHADDFLNRRVKDLEQAEQLNEEKGICLCAYNADLFGHWWYEGPEFIEKMFRKAAIRDDVHFVTPSEYVNKIESDSYQISMPEFSSWGSNGYAETWLDSSNDWIYRHLLRSVDRMIELAERFPDDGGLKERALNQAAREILLAQSSDWASILKLGYSREYVRSRVEECIKNFTNIYESLGSNYISTEWLTKLERCHNIFPDINYRVFRRKR